jgi:leucyl/phenylalanyl-tRNA--protein transferase
MPLHALDNTLWFPPPDQALPDGLLAIGGDVTPERLLLAYRQGIFPWYDSDTPLWWSPNPRFVLFPDELRVSRNMQRLLRRDAFEFRVNTAFDQVITQCKSVTRKGQDGTWITDEVQAAYSELHRLGHAHSAEAWSNGQLVGGLYGVRMGNMYFGESMFSQVPDASKYAFIRYVQVLLRENVQLIDCQVYTKHLESLGARMIMREQFLQLLKHIV